MFKVGSTLFALVFCFSLLTAQITVSGITSTVQTGNVLRYDIDFSVSPAASAYVEYGYWNGTDTIWNATAVSATAAQHSLSLIGLRAQETYAFRVIALNETGCVSASGTAFTTASLPSSVGFALVDSVWTAPGVQLPGYVLSTTHDADPRRLGQLFDREGNILWYQEMTGDPSLMADGLCQYMNLSDTHSVFLLECGRILELGLDGSTRTDVNVHALRPNVYPHHSVFRNRDGNITALVAVVDTVDLSSVGGSANAIVVAPGILEVDDQGNEVWFWSAFDHYNPVTSHNPSGYWEPRFGIGAIDWKHANSLAQDLDGNYLMCLRDENRVIKVSRITGNPLWGVGQNGTIGMMVADSFYSPASIARATGSNYLLVDNGFQDTLTRVMDWWIDWGYTAPTVFIDREFVLPEAYFNGDGGSAARLPGNNTLVASRKGGIFEFDLSSDLLWFARQDTSLSNAYYLSDLYSRAEPDYDGPTLFCLTDTAEQLSGIPAGGYWFGPGVSDNIFNATVAGPGSHTLQYKYGQDTVSVSVMVDADPDCSVAVEPGRAWNLHFNAFPNPFSAELTLCYTLVTKTELHMELFSLDGRRLGTVFQGTQSPGDQVLHLDLSGLGLAEGPVMLRIRSGDGGVSSRLLLHIP